MRGDSKTINGISFSWDGDWFRAVGTATGDIGWSSYQSSDIPVKAGRTYTLSIDFDGDVPDGYSRVALQLFTDVKKNVCINAAVIYRDPLHATFTVPDGDYERLQIWGPIIKGGATVDLRVRWMLVEGDTPAAWAPAEGESLAGVGTLMSANLWKAESVTPAGIPADGIYACSGTRGVRTNVALDRLAENQTFHCGFSVNPGANDAFNVTLCYRDAAGSVNYAAIPDASVTAGKWTRVSGSVVVPSGMTVYQMVICNNSNASGASGWKVTNPTLSLGSPVCLASSAHTPYATQDHVAAEYATKAALRVTSDAVTAEVEERGKLAGRVDGLESTSDTHTSKLEQLATSIKSLVKGESTYTDPNGQSATSGIYSLVTQTRDSVTALFGSYTKTADMQSQIATAKSQATSAANSATDGKLASYTKTADLAATEAVKDAKAAGTAAQASIDGMKLGGRNLLKGTSMDVVTGTYPSSAYRDYLAYQTIDVPDGDTYTLSFDAKSTHAGDVINCYFYSPNTTLIGISSTGGSGTGNDGYLRVKLTADWQRYWCTWTQSATTKRKIVIPFRCEAGRGSGTVSMRGVKLEAGNKATDWSPAPEDTDSAVAGAKKAGTDAQAAASAAQTTANAASSTAGAAKSTADSLATMVRQYSGGVLVGKVGQQVGALVNADGSFDVVNVTWNSGTPTVGKKLMCLAKNGIEFNNPDTSYNICNITANGTLTNIDVPNGSLAIDEMPAWCQATGDSGYDSFIAGKMLQLGAGNRTTYSEILIEPDGTTIDGYKFALGTNNTTDTWVPVMGGHENAGYLVHRDINLKWGPNAYAVYGAYNPNNGGDHYYTTNVNEYNKLIKSGWTGSGVYFYAAL